ncbi:MAG: hypothetical protein ACRD2L_04960 [Terriglobia bacterium]
MTSSRSKVVREGRVIEQVGRRASRQGALSEWPEYVRELAGAWSDLPSAQQLRKLHGRDAKRARL